MLSTVKKSLERLYDSYVDFKEKESYSSLYHKNLFLMLTPVNSTAAAPAAEAAPETSRATAQQSAASQRDAAVNAQFEQALQIWKDKRAAWLKKDANARMAASVLQKADLDHPTKEIAIKAARCADLLAVKKITENGFKQWSDPEIMVAACRTPFVANVMLIQRLGGKINVRNAQGVTALRAAVSNGNVDVVKYLVASGADIREIDDKGRPLPAYAAWNDQLEMLKYLLTQGFDIETKDAKGRTLLGYAAGAKNRNVCAYLIKHDADVDAKDKYGVTPLMRAASEGNVFTIKCLLDEDADIDEVDNRGWTALHYAAAAKERKNYDYLVKRGADESKKDKSGKTAKECWGLFYKK